MIPIPSGVKVWIATGITDMRRGMNGLSLQVQEAFGRDPHAGDLYVFRGRRGDLIKMLWHDGLGLSLYAKRLERGRFVWPSANGSSVAISAAQLTYMLDGIDVSAQQTTGHFWLDGCRPRRRRFASPVGRHSTATELRSRQALWPWADR